MGLVSMLRAIYLGIILAIFNWSSSAEAFVVGGSCWRPAVIGYRFAPRLSTSSTVPASHDIMRVWAVESATSTDCYSRWSWAVPPRKLRCEVTAVFRSILRMSTSAAEEAVDDLPEGHSLRQDMTAVGLENLTKDALLAELVGQDYGMMAMLRSDKFKALIMYLRNIPQNEWVSSVAKEYAGDDDVKNMMIKLGQLMAMRKYYQLRNTKTPK